MTRTKKLLMVLLASVLALLTLFTGALIPTKADEPGTKTKKVSVLDTGGISFLLYYDGYTTKAHNTNTVDFVPEGGITSYDQDVTVKSTWAGRWGVEAVQLYIMVDLTGTPYENYNSVTIELSRLKPEGLNYAPVDIDGMQGGIGGPVADIEFQYKEEDDASAKNFKMQKVGGFESKQACMENGGFTTTINKAECEKRFVLYNDNNIFKSAMYAGPDDEANAELNVTFDFACYVEIDEDKIGTNKAEDWFNETGGKISDFVSENLGVTIGGTTSLVVIVAVVLVIFLRRRRR